MAQNITTYEPMGSYITLDLPAISETTKGGVIKSQEMLEEEKRKFTGAIKVVHVGPNVKQIVPGNKVLLANNAPMAQIEVLGRKLWQVDSYAVLGILK